MTNAEEKSALWQLRNHPMMIGGDAFHDVIMQANINPAFVAGYEEAEGEWKELVYRLAEAILFDWDNKEDFAKDVLVKIKGETEPDLSRYLVRSETDGVVIKTDKHVSVRYASFYGTNRYLYGQKMDGFRPGDDVKIVIMKK